VSEVITNVQLNERDEWSEVQKGKASGRADGLRVIGASVGARWACP
jgi:hypothetical protein